MVRKYLGEGCQPGLGDVQRTSRGDLPCMIAQACMRKFAARGHMGCAVSREKRADMPFINR